VPGRQVDLLGRADGHNTHRLGIDTRRDRVPDQQHARWDQSLRYRASLNE
jgi:hypothetical protein